MRLPGRRGWSEDPLWGRFYDWMVEHPGAGGALWRAGLRSDLGRLYDATDEISRLPAGSRVLDVPCGGGVALRGARPGQGLDYVAADISSRMLARTRAAAGRRGVDDQVTTEEVDVADLPFPSASFDLVVSFTGLHCFPDPARAVVEMVRVLRPGAAVTGSAVLNDTGRRHELLRRVGRRAGLMGPGCTGDEVVAWLEEQGCREVTLERSGALGYFRGVRADPTGPPGTP